MATHMVILLSSSTPSTLAQQDNILKVRTWLEGFKIDFKEIDGADAANKEVRTELFNLADSKAYPLVFITDKVSKTEYVGNFDTVMQLVEDNGLPAEVAKTIPGLKTFDTVFASCKKQ